MNSIVRIASVLMFVWCACVQAVAEPPRTFDGASWQTLLDGRKGQPVIVVEAMKMENELRTTSGGVVRNILVHPGMAVEKGALLVEFS